MGVHDGLNREVPFYLGQKDEEKANELAATAQGYMLLLSVLSLVGFGVTALYYLAHADMEYAAGYARSGHQCFPGVYRSILPERHLPHPREIYSALLDFESFRHVEHGFSVGGLGFWLLRALFCVQRVWAFGTLALAYVGRPLRLRPRLSWASPEGAVIVVGAPDFRRIAAQHPVADVEPNLDIKRIGVNVPWACSR